MSPMGDMGQRSPGWELAGALVFVLILLAILKGCL